jgi:hypothetical protein
MKVKAKSIFLWPAFMCFLSLAETHLHEYLKMANVSCHTNQNLGRPKRLAHLFLHLGAEPTVQHIRSPLYTSHRAISTSYPLAAILS